MPISVAYTPERSTAASFVRGIPPSVAAGYASVHLGQANARIAARTKGAGVRAVAYVYGPVVPERRATAYGPHFAVGVTDRDGRLVGAISVDDLLEALLPSDWRRRAEASSDV